MKYDLEQLLRESDAEMGSSTGASSHIANLGDRVRRLRSRKRTIRRGIAACGFAIGITSIAIVSPITKTFPPTSATKNHLINTHQKTATTTIITTTHPRVHNQPSTSWDAIAQIHERTAAILMSDRPSPKRAARRSVDIDAAHQQRDHAALILIYEADRYLREKRSADAIAAYQRAVDLFPQSQWADVARERLKQYES